jgi:CheY-like chemotaxis protein
VASATAALASLQAASRRHEVLILGHYGGAQAGLTMLSRLVGQPGGGDLKVILATPLRDRPTHAAAREAGIDGLLVKPLRLRDLRKVLGGQRATKTSADTSHGNTGANFSGRVLVAEDNLVNQEVARALLEMAGLSVDTVPDGQAAVDAWAAAGYDLILMDCQMPGMSGYDATAEIRARERLGNCARTPIVALTANSMQGDRERCLDAGMDDYMAKPFTDEQLRVTLLRWLPFDRLVWTETVSAVGPQDDLDRLFNPQALEVLGAGQRTARSDLLRRVVDGYLEQSLEHLAMLSRGLVQGDAAAVAFAAHALKASSATVGAEQLAGHCRDIEDHARDGRLEMACAAIENIGALHAEVCALLRARYVADAA